MEPNPDRKVSMTVSVMSIALCRDEQNSFFCARCGNPVAIHQPDAELPYRMLGTCDQCHVWYLITCDPAEDRAITIELPDVSQFDLDKNATWPTTNSRQT